jgi:hypothetical protein
MALQVFLLAWNCLNFLGIENDEPMFERLSIVNFSCMALQFYRGLQTPVYARGFSRSK